MPPRAISPRLRTRPANAAFTPITNVLEDFSLTLDETKNIDLVFNYSENEIAALQSLGVWAQNQMGRINAVASTRAAKVYDALTNAASGAGLAANKTSLTIADASNFIGASGNTEKGERLSALLWMVNANLTLWDRGLDMFGDGSGSGGPGEVVFLVNRKLLEALNYYADRGHSEWRRGHPVRQHACAGVGLTGRLATTSLSSITTWTTRSPPPVISTWPSPSTAGQSRGSGGAITGLLRRTRWIAATGNPTPIKVMGTRYAYAYGLPDSNLVLSLDSDVTAN